MLIMAFAFTVLTFLSANFSYPTFASALILMGVGNGLFLSPNTTSIMNSVPPAHRGAASGMRQTLQNTGLTIGQALFFAIVISSLNTGLPTALSSAVTALGAPAQLGHALATTPASSAIFAAFLGYNPMQAILHALPTVLVSAIPKSTLAYLTGSVFLPTAFSSPFMAALKEAFCIGAILCFIAAFCSALRGKKPKTQKINRTKADEENVT
jgi:MFS family permease